MKIVISTGISRRISSTRQDGEDATHPRFLASAPKP
jgi:hypothetical protein